MQHHACRRPLPREPDLAERLGLSRSSLREAVKAPSLIHVLDVRQGDGTYVTSLEPGMQMGAMEFVVDFPRDDTMLRFLEVQRILEPAATAMAATAMSDRQIDKLRAIVTVIASRQQEVARAWATCQASNCGCVRSRSLTRSSPDIVLRSTVGRWRQRCRPVLRQGRLAEPVPELPSTRSAVPASSHTGQSEPSMTRSALIAETAVPRAGILAFNLFIRFTNTHVGNGCAAKPSR